MDATTTGELITLTRNFFTYKKDDIKEADQIFEKLVNTEEIKVKEMDRNDGSIHPSRLPKEHRSLARITYIIKKWYFARMTGKNEIVVYIFGEERPKYSIEEKITHIH